MRRIKTHTIEKLEYLRKYINGYLKATKRLPTKYFIDAFAGTGKCILCEQKCKSRGGLKCEKCVKGKQVDGSALLALKTQGYFNGYWFIDLNKIKVGKLRKNIAANIQENILDRVRIEEADSNEFLKNIHRYIPHYAGCLIFLDPEGPELHWNTIICLSKIKKAELFILYPYDMALVRLTKDHKEKLNKFYGTTKWLDFYNKIDNYSPEKRKRSLLDFYIENLKELGFEYVVYKQIKQKIREGKDLYHLILATHHPAGKRIMEDIFNKELDGQTKMKFST